MNLAEDAGKLTKLRVLGFADELRLGDDGGTPSAFVWGLGFRVWGLGFRV